MVISIILREQFYYCFISEVTNCRAEFWDYSLSAHGKEEQATVSIARWWWISPDLARPRLLGNMGHDRVGETQAAVRYKPLILDFQGTASRAFSALECRKWRGKW